MNQDERQKLLDVMAAQHKRAIASMALDKEIFPKAIATLPHWVPNNIISFYSMGGWSWFEVNFKETLSRERTLELHQWLRDAFNLTDGHIKRNVTSIGKVYSEVTIWSDDHDAHFDIDLKNLHPLDCVVEQIKEVTTESVSVTYSLSCPNETE